jgi:hypothetical protein
MSDSPHPSPLPQERELLSSPEGEGPGMRAIKVRTNFIPKDNIPENIHSFTNSLIYFTSTEFQGLCLVLQN